MTERAFKIPLIIVDDESIDRLIARKRISRSPLCEVFDPIREYEAGDLFLADFIARRHPGAAGKPVVLMDVNMPRMNGFETIDAMADAALGRDDKIVVMMFTSSDNPSDIARAEERPLVKGYITKPLEEGDIERIIEIYTSDNPD